MNTAVIVLLCVSIILLVVNVLQQRGLRKAAGRYEKAVEDRWDDVYAQIDELNDRVQELEDPL